MKKPKAPCQTCEKREVGCHAYCEIFSEYEKARDEWHELVIKNKKEARAVRIGKGLR